MDGACASMTKYLMGLIAAEKESPLKKSVRMVTLRLPEEALSNLDERAAEAGVSRSDYLRALCAIPFGTDDGFNRDELQTKTGKTGDNIETDDGLADLRDDIGSIADDYKKTVEYLDQMTIRFARNKYIGAGERNELIEMVNDLTRQNERIWDCLFEIGRELDAIADRPSMVLSAEARSTNLPPVNNIFDGSPDREDGELAVDPDCAW